MQQFHEHPELRGKHAFLGASNHSWTKDTPEQLYNRIVSSYATQRGTKFHTIAKYLIKTGIKLSDTVDSRNLVMALMMLDNLVVDDEDRPIHIPKEFINLEQIFPTLMAYVNDGIGFGMSPEVKLKHSDEAFGTVDTICFTRNVLRIHDLKTGVKPASFEQLIIYAALYFLEYKKKLEKVEVVLALYQNGEIFEYRPDKSEIAEKMETIITDATYVQKILDESEG